MTMTTVLAGESDELTEDDLADVYANTCPSSDANSQSNDNNDDTVSSVPRYGAVNGYAYATDRCVCYTDGSGCDCDEQNENLAVKQLVYSDFLNYIYFTHKIFSTMQFFLLLLTSCQLRKVLEYNVEKFFYDCTSLPFFLTILKKAVHRCCTQNYENDKYFHVLFKT